MKRAIIILTAFCSAAMLIPVEVEAKRLGGGRNIGTPRDAVTQRQATPPPAATPAQPAAPASAAMPKATPTPAAAAQQPGWKRWMGPIAGIAAGLGIAALMSHLGLSEAFGNFLMLALIGIAVIALIGFFLRRRAKPAEGIQYRGNELAGAGPAGSPTPPSMFGGAGAGVAAASAAAAQGTKAYPEGFEPEPFVRQAKANFIQLQRAYDDGDASVLRDVMTPEMYAEVSKELESRGVHHSTEVVTLNAEIVEVVTDRDAHWASVRFTGLLREDGKPTPETFDEVWNLTKPVNGETGWLLAGIQQLQ